MLARVETAGGAGLLRRDLAKDSDEERRAEESRLDEGLPLDALLLPRDELLPILSNAAKPKSFEAF